MIRNVITTLILIIPLGVALALPLSSSAEDLDIVSAGSETVVCADAVPLYALTQMGDVVTYNAKGKPIGVRIASAIENTLLAQADAKSKGNIKKRAKYFSKAKRKLEKQYLKVFKNKKKVKLFKTLCASAPLPGGSIQPPPPPATIRDDLCSRADRNHNGIVDQDDLMFLLANFGQLDSLSDIDRDGTVDIDDLLIVLSLFGQQCMVTSSSSSSSSVGSSSSNSSSSSSSPASSSSSSEDGQSSSSQSSSSSAPSSSSSSVSSANDGQCRESTETWQNSSLTPQLGSFRVLVDVIPRSSAMDGVVALSSGAISGYSNGAALVRFNTSGTIDVRDGATYRANNVVSYQKDMRYRLRLEVNIPQHRYDVYVTPPTGDEIQLATNYAFRTEQSGVSSINNLGFIADVGSLSLCNHTVQTLTSSSSSASPSSSSSSSSSSSTSSSSSASARIPIGRWDLVPDQRIRAGETLNLGVVAFSLPGVNRVEITVTGQGYQGANPLVATQMTDNLQTGVVEYWVPLRASDFLTSGPIQVSATIVGNDGGIRNADVGEGDRGLEVLTFYVDPNNSLPRNEVWVDPVNGNNSTGVVGNSSRPFKTVNAGIYYAGSGGIVWLRPGNHTWSGSLAIVGGPEWVTVQPAAGATRDNTILTTMGAPTADHSVIWQAQKLHLKNLTLLGQNVVQIDATAGRNSAVWVDGCILQGYGRVTEHSNPIGINYDAGYWTDTTISDMRNALMNNWSNRLARNVTATSISDNVFNKIPLVINGSVSDHSPLLDFPKIVNATYYPSGTSAYPGYQRVLVKPGAFINYSRRDDEEFRFDLSTRNSNSNAYNYPKAKVAAKLSNDAIALDSGFEIPQTQAVISGWLQRNWHSDVWQWEYAEGNDWPADIRWKGREHNMIVYGLEARNCLYQGISNNSWSDQAENYPAEGMAFVNVYTECTYGSYWMRLTNHMLLWNVTFNEQFGFFADVGSGGAHNNQSSVTDLSIRGSLFNKCFNDYLSEKPAYGTINFTDARDNHYRYSGTQCAQSTRTPGTDYTTGDPGIDANGIPLAGSPLKERFSSPLTKRDLDGTLRGSQSAVGAYE